MKPSDRVTKMMARKVNLRQLKAPGSYLDLHEKITLELAREYQRQEDPDYVSVSWPNQERAQRYFNSHGFEKTLEHMLAIQRDNERAKVRI